MHGSKITFRRESGENILEAEQWVPRGVAEVFRFFSAETNLEALTPPHLSFKVLDKSTPEIETGTLIRYRLRIRGFPVGWITRIDEWVPGVRFVDTQLSGPYALWHHTHQFESLEGGTLMKDRVRFRVPLGRIGQLLTGGLVRRDVEGIFRYRMQVIARMYGATG